MILACGNPLMSGDGYCDDVNNKQECNFDGGDCCLDTVLEDYCKICECLEPESKN